MDRKQFNMFFGKMMDGFAYHRIIVDSQGKPVDYVFLEVNPAFERLTGLKREEVIGKKVTEAIQGIENDSADWIGMYGKVALTCESTEFENYSEALGKWFRVSAYCPEKEYFVAVFEDITERKKAEQTVKQSLDREHFLAELIRNASVAIAVGYPDGRIGLINHAFKELTGYSEQELQSVTWNTVLTPPEYLKLERAKLAELKAENPSVSFQKEYIRKDGSRVPVELVSHAFFDEKGNVTQYFAFVTDISERRKSEDEIRQLQDYLLLQVNRMPIGLIVWGPDFRVQSWNPAAAKIFGFTEEEAIGEHPYDLIVPKKAQAVVAKVWGRLLKGDKTANSVNENVTKDGRTIICDWSNTPLKKADGTVIGAMSMVQDITERKKAEEALKQSETRLKIITDNTTDPIYLKDRESRIVMANPACTRAIGKTLDQVIGKNDMEFYDDPKIGRDIVETDKRIMEKGITQTVEENIDTPEGLRVYLSTKTPHFDNDGRVAGIIGVSRDITERKKVEEALKESQSTLQSIIDGSPSFIFLKDRDGRFITINKRLEESLGIKREDLRGKTDYDIFSKEVADCYRVNDQRVLETKRPIQAEEIFDSPDGNRYTLLANKFPLSNSSGDVIATCSISTDITDRKKAEEALKQRNDDLEQLQLKLEAKAAEVEEYATRMEELVEERTNRVTKQASLIDLSPDAILMRGLDGTISFWSAGAEKLYGWTSKEAIGQVSQDLLKTVFPLSLCEIDAQVRVTGSWSGELRHKTKGDREVIVESRWLAEKSRTGKTVDILESNVDITERKKAEAAVQSERQRLFDVLETLPVMICLITPDYHIAFANRGFRERFGESKGRPCYEYCWGQTKPCKFCESLTPFETGKPHRWEVTGPDGRTIEAYDYPFTDIDGKQLVLEMDIDITARKKAEAEAIESARKLKDAERLAAIGATAGMVGHDIRNPLQAITSDVYLAKSELDALPDSEGKKAILESLVETEKNVDYINKIVQDLQDYARPINPNIEESDLKEIVEKLITKNGMPSNIEVNVQVTEEARKISADSYYLNRILYNLVTNAIQAMPQGGSLTVKTERESKDMLITVQDTGIGIPPDMRTKIFTVMFTTKSKGQGFGLPVVKRMTEALGGTVTFESELGKGTRFIVRLPPQNKSTHERQINK